MQSNPRAWMFSPPLNSSPPAFEQYLQFLNGNCSPEIRSSNVSGVSVGQLPRSVSQKIPCPPPNPSYYHDRRLQSCTKLKGCNCVPRDIVESWDKLFEDGYKADVRIITADGFIIAAHSNVLDVASPVLKNLLNQQKGKFLPRSISITDMEKYVLHLFVLAHAFSTPSLKRICTECLEQGLLTTENVVDVLQLARLCDAPRLNLLSMRLIVKNFKTIAESEGWRAMRHSNPLLEQELLRSVAESESEKEQRLRMIEEKKTYLQLQDAMEALIHICRDGCRTVGPHDKDLDGNQDPCKFPTCKGLESLVRHFAACKTRVPGGCGHCKRMWQLLELHSWMCAESETCKVPLCMYFKEKIQHQSKKNEMKWKLLVSKIVAAKRGLLPVSSLYSKSIPLQKVL